nr:putative late blight resistance protein homolog R1A-10 isoform X1 [Ipomoea batatas]GME03952.1 putative late blight resistance protein homolog R1A-10 isoform X1 [Ipomoea batatas]
MAYAAVTSLMETLSLNFLQSQPPFPLEDLAAQMRDDANQNLGLLQQILQDMAIMEDLEVEVDEASSNLSCIKACLPRLHGIFNNEAVKQADYIPKKKKMMIKSEKQLQLTESESSSQNERIADAGHGDSILLSSRLREVAEIKQNIVSLHEKLGFLQETLEKSEICYDKDLEAEMRDVLFKAEERIEMELTTIYLAKHSRLRITACLLRLHEIFIEAQKQTDYLKNQLMIRPQNETITDDVSLLGRMRSRGLLLLETLSIRSWGCLKHIPCREIIWATNFLPNLKKLNLLESNLQWSDLRLICMLPNLEVLKLINACKGLKWETYDGGFRRLKRLVIVKANLQYWNAVGDHFPILECLEISHCYSLEEIPPGFGDIATLALIKISYCSNSLMASAKWIQDEQNNNYGNAALLDCSKGFGPLDMMDGAIALQDVN